MSGGELADRLTAAGLSARLDGERIRVGPKERLTPELEALIRAGREALRRHLLAGPGGDEDEARADELAAYVGASLAGQGVAKPGVEPIDEAERAAKLEAAEGLDPFRDHPALHRIVWERVPASVSPLGWVARLAESPPRRGGW